MLDLNISRVTELHYTNCTGAHSALRIKIDFEDFRTDPYFEVELREHKTISTAFDLIRLLNWVRISIFIDLRPISFDMP